MINYRIFNDNPLNDPLFIGDFTIGETISSFSNEILTKYSFKSDFGSIFNFNTIADFCKPEKNQIYGNILISANFNNIPEIGVKEYQTPLKNGGILQNRRFEKQVIELELEIVSNNITNLEKEIQLMKQTFNNPGKLYKKYNGDISYLDVFLTSFTVGPLKYHGTEVKIKFESLSPFWTSETVVTKSFENQNSRLNATVMIIDSDYSSEFQAILQVGNISGSINKIILSIDGYELEINENIIANSVIVFDGKNYEITVNGTPVIYLGEFIEIPVGRPCKVKIDYGDGNILNYNFYVLYDKIVL
ncbi:hypothetical protein BKN14_00450 [Candidatus Gracilibacteria bacterium HOT-871]|nr:hypothetical protein BKN14_00450 [Candidatus Gracilibacteria bacterium HOT-871]